MWALDGVGRWVGCVGAPGSGCGWQPADWARLLAVVDGGLPPVAGSCGGRPTSS